MVVGIQSPDLFTDSVLTMIVDLTERFEAIPQLEKITILTNISLIRGKDDLLLVESPFTEIPKEQKILDSLKNDILSDRLLRNTIISNRVIFLILALN